MLILAIHLDQDGLYTVELTSTNDDGCEDVHSEVITVVNKTTGITTLEELTVTITTDENMIFITTNKEFQGTVTVHSTAGQEVLNDVYAGMTYSKALDINAAGYYFVKLFNDDHSVIEKIMIAR